MVSRHRLALAGIVFVAALSACSEGATGEVSPPPQPTTQAITSDEALRDGMRQLWTEHVTWTRVFIIDVVAGLPDTLTATGRLLRNQDDIGNAIKPFYGDAAGNQLTALLRQHITGAAAVVAAAKAGDSALLNRAMADWYANADAIAELFAAMNPNWRLEDMRAMMHDHLARTTLELAARLSADWLGDVRTFDGVVQQALGMADSLTDGLVAQFPDLVARQTATPAREDLHLTMRKLWEDHVIWTRVFIIDDVAGLPDAPVAAMRLMQNQVDIGNTLRPYYGDAIAGRLTVLLQEHIAGAAKVLDAAKAGDMSRFHSANAAWYSNGYDIAAFLAGANPNWSIADLGAMMTTHLDQTLDEASARLAQDWARDVAAYDAIEAHILDMADTLSQGLADQFSESFLH